MTAKLAVLIPVYNGGAMLAPTVASCAGAGLTAGEYEIIVVDNCSTDGAVQGLPECDARGARIQVHTNSTNLGRVGNWNRAVEIAHEQGFSWFTFLFVGDSWMPSGSLPRLLRLMTEHQAEIGLAAFECAYADGKPQAIDERFGTATGEAVVDSTRFLTEVLATGLLPFGPIQANVYRTSTQLRFDPNLARTTDVEATVEYVSRCRKPVVLLGSPYFSWRAHGQRFHTATRVIDFIQDAPRMFERARNFSGIPVDGRRAISILFVNALRSVVVFERPLGWPRAFAQVLTYYRGLPDRVSLREAGRVVMARVVERRHLIEVH
jgi:glycosyltransferase involved in cell wall biosynthesis